MTLKQIYDLAVQIGAENLPVHTLDSAIWEKEDTSAVNSILIRFYDSEHEEYLEERELYSHIDDVKMDEDTVQYYRENYITKVLLLS